MKPDGFPSIRLPVRAAAPAHLRFRFLRPLLRPSLLLAALLFPAANAALVAAPRSSARPVDFAAVRFLAAERAARPYQPEQAAVPAFLQRLSYDEYREIEFRRDQSLWRRLGTPFQVQFFHPGFLFNRAVRFREVTETTVFPIGFDPGLFHYHRTRLAEPVPRTVGFAGFRLLYPLNKADDEAAVFLGASYFRMLPRGAVYGLSARGLALGSGEPGPEEFPAWTDFWLVRPAPGATAFEGLALLDSPSVVGAYHFRVEPGAVTTAAVEAELHPRRPLPAAGFAPLTSMFWYGEADGTTHGDFRPEVHDSDGLAIHFADGEWLWRPLALGRAPRLSSFSAERTPTGFGLLQRDRAFSSYEDEEARYDLRPSAWIEPLSGFGAGHVRLVELPTADETHDNIVAYWVPAAAPQPGRPVLLRYRLHKFLESLARPPGAAVVATRIGRVLSPPDPALRQFVVDFVGPSLAKLPAGQEATAEVTVGPGAACLFHTVVRTHQPDRRRLVFHLRPNGSGEAVELRAFLRAGPDVVSETWSYRWEPPPEPR